MKKKIFSSLVSVCLLANLAIMPVSAAGGYDIQIKLIPGELVAKTPLVPVVEIKKGLEGTPCGGQGNPNIIVDFKNTYDLDVHSTFTERTKKGDKVYLSLKIAGDSENRYNIYNLEKAGKNLVDTDPSTWFAIGDVHCLAFDLNRDNECTINLAETKRMNEEREALLKLSEGYPVKVYADNQLIPLTVEPVIINGTTYLPMRDIANICDMDVNYYDTGTDMYRKYGKGKTPVASVSVAGLDKAMFFPIDEEGYYAKDITSAETFEKGIGAKLINGRTMLPIRKLVEFSGLTIAWDGVQKRIDIDSPNE